MSNITEQLGVHQVDNNELKQALLDEGIELAGKTIGIGVPDGSMHAGFVADRFTCVFPGP